MERDTYRQDVDDTHYHGQNACGDDDSPECESKGLLTHRLDVEIAQHRDSENHHDPRQRYEPSILAEQGPVAIEVAAENGEL